MNKKMTIRNTEQISQASLQHLNLLMEKISPFCPAEPHPVFQYRPEKTGVPSVSVIIPVYNTEHYLVQMLDSLVRQTLSDIEIICVDDSSSDATVDILAFYAALDGRVQVVRQPNAGGGAARNLGMTHARGKYLAFMDADDFCTPDMLQVLFETAERDRSEIVISRRCDYHTAERKFLDTFPFPPEWLDPAVPFAGKDHPDHLYYYCRQAPWGKLFSAEFIRGQGLLYQEIRNSNDGYFNLMAVSLARRISLVDKPLYYYRIGMRTNTQALKYKDPLLFLEVLKKIKNDLTAKGLFKIYENSYKEILCMEFYYIFPYLLKLQLGNTDSDKLFTFLFQAANEEFTEEFFSGFPVEACVEKQAWKTVRDLHRFDGSPIKFLLDQYQRKNQYCQDLENSSSYRIGKLITWLPKMLRKAFISPGKSGE